MWLNKYKQELKEIYKQCATNKEKYVEGIWYLSGKLQDFPSTEIELILNWHYIMTNGGK